jgi:hypothetical protein
MNQAGDIATVTSWYSVSLTLGKSLEFIFQSQPKQGDVREGVLNKNTHERGQSVTCTIMLSTYTV